MSAFYNEGKFNREHWTCFACRKVFRQPATTKLTNFEPRRWSQVERPEASCPDCRQPMCNMGPYFRTPRRENIRAWQAAQILGEQGLTFFDMDNNCFVKRSIGKRPNLRQVKQYAAKCLSYPRSQGERLLKEIDARQKRHYGRGK